MKIKVYNRSCEEDYFESQKLFWWEPFYSNSKYEIIFDYDNYLFLRDSTNRIINRKYYKIRQMKQKLLISLQSILCSKN